MGFEFAQNNGGAVSISTSESRTNVAFGTLPTPDQITGIVLPTNGLIEVWYQAMWQESVGEAAMAALFLGANQVKMQVGNGPGFAAAGVTNNATPAIVRTLATSPIGLISSTGPGVTADVTTGQIAGLYPTGSVGGAYYIFSGVATVGNAPVGSLCYIFAAAGTYTVSVQFKASSGSVTVSNRRLRARVV